MTVQPNELEFNFVTLAKVVLIAVAPNVAVALGRTRDRYRCAIGDHAWQVRPMKYGTSVVKCGRDGCDASLT